MTIPTSSGLDGVVFIDSKISLKVRIPFLTRQEINSEHQFTRAHSHKVKDNINYFLTKNITLIIKPRSTPYIHTSYTSNIEGSVIFKM